MDIYGIRVYWYWYNISGSIFGTCVLITLDLSKKYPLVSRLSVLPQTVSVGHQLTLWHTSREFIVRCNTVIQTWRPVIWSRSLCVLTVSEVECAMEFLLTLVIGAWGSSRVTLFGVGQLVTLGLAPADVDIWYIACFFGRTLINRRLRICFSRVIGRQ